MSVKEELTRISIELGDPAPFPKESVWARSLGRGYYEIRNYPFFAYDIHYLDKVRAKADPDGGSPTLTRVVSHSGHKTLRVLFSDTSPEPDDLVRLRSLKERFGVKAEGWGNRFYALDVPPESNYPAIIAQLTAWENEEQLKFEFGCREDHEKYAG